MATAQFLNALNPQAWTLTDPEKRANGSSSAWVNGSDGGRPAFQAIKGDVAFEPGYGVAADQQQTEDMSEKMLKVELNVRPENPDAAEFMQECDKADNALVKWGAENSLKLFRQELPPAMVAKLLRPLVKSSPPGELQQGGGAAKSYPPRFRVKINTKDFVEKDGRQIPNARKTQVFVVNSDTTYRRGTIQDVRRGCEVICIVEIPSAWISGMSFGYNVMASKVLVFPNAAHASSALTFNLAVPMVMDAAADADQGEQDMDM
jgi:hypothetical protein